MSKIHLSSQLELDRAQVQELALQVQEITGETVEIAFVDQGYTGEQAAQDAAAEGIQLEVVKLPEAKKGFVLLPLGGWLSEVLRGLGDSDDWQETMSDYRKLAWFKNDRF